MNVATSTAMRETCSGELPYLAMYNMLRAAKTAGDTSMSASKFDDAAEHYSRALEWGTKSDHLTLAKQSALYLARAQAYLGADKLGAARSDVDEAIRLRPSCPRGWVMKGRLLQTIGAFSEAADAFAVACSCPQTGRTRSDGLGPLPENAAEKKLVDAVQSPGVGGSEEWGGDWVVREAAPDNDLTPELKRVRDLERKCRREQQQLKETAAAAAAAARAAAEQAERQRNEYLARVVEMEREGEACIGHLESEIDRLLRKVEETATPTKAAMNIPKSLPVCEGTGSHPSSHHRALSLPELLGDNDEHHEEKGARTDDNMSGRVVAPGNGAAEQDKDAKSQSASLASSLVPACACARVCMCMYVGARAREPRKQVWWVPYE